MEVGKRIVYKVSGEALKGKLRINMQALHDLVNRNLVGTLYDSKLGNISEEDIVNLVSTPSNIDEEMIEIVCNGAKELHKNNKEVIIVPGAGNLWRGRQKTSNMDEIVADQIGMLGINMNALAIGEKLERMGIDSRVISSIPVEEFGVEYNDIKKNRKHLSNGEILVIGGGTGSPLCTSDSATIKAAHEYSADTILFGKSIDGIYDSDPRKNKDARKYKYLTYEKLIEDQLRLGVANQGVMDFEAMARLLKNPIDIITYLANDDTAITKIVNNEDIGTTITKKIKKPEFY